MINSKPRKKSIMSTRSKTVADPLPELIRQINSLDKGVLDQMVACGKLLLRAKALLQKAGNFRKHNGGGFQAWIKANLKISPQSAFRYIRLAKSPNPLKLHQQQRATAATRQKKYTVRNQENARAADWARMSPINRAKAAFNAMEKPDREKFLAWIAEQLDAPKAERAGRRLDVMTAQIAATA